MKMSSEKKKNIRCDSFFPFGIEYVCSGNGRR